MKTKQVPYKALPANKVGVATFGYIGFADREFFLRIFEDYCEEPVAWSTHETISHGKVSSLFTTGDLETVLLVVEFFAEVAYELHRRAVYGKCFGGNLELPIPVM